MQSVFHIGNGISLLDARYIQEDIAAVYLLRQADEVAIIETGTKHTLPYIEKALNQQELDFADVAYVIPTHVHLDHAAGAGMLMDVCDNAKLVIHPYGAKHMIDPSKLIAGTIAVYGEEKFQQFYGEIMPVDSNRVIEAGDGFKLDFNGRILEFLDTPGHARHHFCVWDALSKSMFTGDTFGLSYREFDVGEDVFILPTTTPVQFDPEAMLQSINRIMQYAPEKICLTHFSAIKPTEAVVKQLQDSIKYMSNLAQKYWDHEQAQQKIERLMMAYLLQGLQNMGVKDMEFCERKLKNDVTLNTQGLIYWQKNLS